MARKTKPKGAPRKVAPRLKIVSARSDKAGHAAGVADVKANFLTLITQPRSVSAAAVMAGVTARTIYRWATEDAEFKAAFDEARDAGTDVAEDRCYELMMQNDDLGTASRMTLAILRARRPDVWDRKPSLAVEATAESATGEKTKIGIQFYGEPAAEDDDD
jgi:hypothetical protein